MKILNLTVLNILQEQISMKFRKHQNKLNV